MALSELAQTEPMGLEFTNGSRHTGPDSQRTDIVSTTILSDVCCEKKDCSIVHNGGSKGAGVTILRN